jgi:nucleoid-associated protein EbfC
MDTHSFTASRVDDGCPQFQWVSTIPFCLALPAARLAHQVGIFQIRTSPDLQHCGNYALVFQTFAIGGEGMKLPGNLQQIMEQAQKMQGSMQQEIDQIKVDTSVGGGAVTVQMDGKKNLLDIKIAPEAAEDVEMLRDLILSAVREAASRVDEEINKKIGSTMAGMGLPRGLF